MTRPITTPVEGKEALMYYFIEATKTDLGKIPDDVANNLKNQLSTGTSPVDACVNATEIIYARASELPTALLAIGASLASMCGNFGFHGLGDDGRGFGIATELRKLPGVTEPTVAPTAAPEPKSEYAEKSPETAAVAPVEPSPVATPAAKP